MTKASQTFDRAKRAGASGATADAHQLFVKAAAEAESEKKPKLRALALLNAAGILRARGQFRGAAELLEGVGRGLGGRLEPAVLSERGVLLRLLGDLDAAQLCHLRAIELLVELEDEGAVAIERGNLGMVCSDLGKLNEAEGHFQSTLSSAFEAKNDGLAARALLQLARVRKERGEWEDAGGLARHAFDLASKDAAVDQQDPTIVGEALLLAAAVAQHQGHEDNAQELLLSAVKRAQDLGQPAQSIAAMTAVGHLEARRCHFDEAHQWFERAESAARGAEASAEVARSLVNRATLDIARGNVDLALARLDAAERFLGDHPAAEISTFLPIQRAQILASRGEFARVEVELDRALRAAGDSRSTQAGRAVVELNRAGLALARGELQSALTRAERARLGLAREPAAAVQASLVRVQALGWLGRLDDAFSETQRCISALQSSSRRDRIADVWLAMAWVGVESGEVGAARDLVSRAVECFENLGHETGSATARQLRGEVALREQDWGAAIDEFEESRSRWADMGARRAELQCLAAGAEALMHLGQAGLAAPRFSQAEAEFETMGAVLDTWRLWERRGSSWVALGDPNRGFGDLTRALAGYSEAGAAHRARKVRRLLNPAG